MSNMIFHKIQYINWKYEAKKIILTAEEMKIKLAETFGSRIKANTKTKRSEYTESTYGLETHGDYVELYLFENNEYLIYSTNMVDNKKNENTKVCKPDRLFDFKFRELNNNISIRKAFGFAHRDIKKCIPRQFYYINRRFCNNLYKASAIDASSQYPSGCLGRLPDYHTAIAVKGRAFPTDEYPFAFYASGHCAEKDVFDTHEWLSNPMFPYLFRLDQKENYAFTPLKDDEELTILMKASEYTMDSTWEYFYANKNSCSKDSPEYEEAKLIMNKTIGSWHRKDKDKKRLMTYDDHGSYQLAHIVAIAIARGNQKILDMVEKIGPQFILHICVDGIIYLGDRKFGIDESKLGKFAQEFIGADFVMKDINVYCARQNNHCIKFKHGGFDLYEGSAIDESQDFTFDDLNKLSCTQRIGEIING